ncbi:hypothetical protein [Sinorhizobium meliloti]|uniref:hypothetical protein n=1 Tax=Rhizobium meliloti TaxID=382 RepID=UPI000FE018A6|nr:hypothetical protein [Sinorhizobium meliloti]MDX0470276.1 hypothetical protein [Sinorhizobium medicae]MDX0716526.1 hypothetical protein [Sinorhizobium medicae]MDX0846188.1 hypothetical protein [Sinorhizobium medicae]MDX1177374.1 hypothetical protein [Sinorhizobium medicae]MDX1250253.1 hypothetical protein [Sinorhizobium medicae]
MTIYIPGEEGSARPESDFKRDMKSLLAVVFPGHFLQFRGPGGVLRALAIAAFLYGIGTAGLGISEGHAFASYDYSVFYILGALPTLLVASMAERRP